jgi:F-type H+-transporting ATPase subunit delta
LKTHVVAKRYAQALYSEAKSAGNLDQVMENLRCLAALSADSGDFSVFLRNPLISKEGKVAVIGSMHKADMFDDFTASFLLVLAMKNRLGLIQEITEYLDYVIMEEKGEAFADVTTAFKLNGESFQSVQTVLDKISGKKITIKNKVSEDVMGGMVAKIGSTLYDASIKGQLDKIRDHLISK